MLLFKTHKLLVLLFLYGVVSYGQGRPYKDSNEIDFSSEGKVGMLLQKSINHTVADSSLYYTKKAYNLYITGTDSALIPFFNYRFGYCYRVLGDYKKAENYFNNVVTQLEPLKKNLLVHYAYCQLALITYEREDYNQSVDYYLKAIEKTNDKYREALIKSDIANIYTDNNNPEIAKVFIDEVFTYFKENTELGLNHPDLAYNYINVANLSTANFKERLKASNKAIKVSANSSNTKLKLDVVYTRGRLYVTNNEYKKALLDFESVLQEAKVFNLDEYKFKAYINMAFNYHYLNQYKTSAAYLDSLSSLNYDTGWRTLEIDSLYAANYYKQNDFKQAYTYLEKYLKVQELKHTTLENDKFTEFAKKYQTERKIQENELLKKEGVIKDLQMSQQKKARNFLIILSVLGLFALSIMYSRYRFKKKSVGLLRQQNTVIKQQKEELEKSNANKQKLFSIIAHDLVNPFNAILGYTKLLEEDYESFNEDERKKFISIINKYANSNYNLTRALLDWAKIQQDKLVVNKINLKCKDVVEEAIRPYQVLADKKNIHITTKIPEHITVEADQNMMQTVIGNLFVNAIKFTPQGGNITFNLDKNTDGSVKLEIEDNGIGMTQEQLNNIFDITRVNTTQGTNQEKGNGLGLIVCKELMELQQGTLQLFSQKGQGSKAVLTV